LHQVDDRAQRASSVQSDLDLRPVRPDEIDERPRRSAHEAAGRSTSPIEDDADESGPVSRTVSLRIGLVISFIAVAVLPAIGLLVLDAGRPGGVFETLPFDQSAARPVLVLICAIFGAGLGLLAARALSLPLAALTRAVEAWEPGHRSVTLPGSEILELARLADAFAALQARVVAQGDQGRRAERDADRERRASDARYEIASRGANDGLWDWDLTKNTVYCSPRWHAIVGVDDGPDLVPSSFWLDRIHPDDLAGLRSALDAHLHGDADQVMCEARLRRDDGTFRWTLCRGLALRREDGMPYRLAGSLTDITERRQAEEQLRHDAMHDALTGLPNRALLLDTLQATLEQAQTSAAIRPALLLLDLDRFKLVNDGLGHAIGDALLVAVTLRLEAVCPERRLLARIGGDELAILVDELTPDGARHLADRIRQALAPPLDVEGQRLFVTASVGVALAGERGQPAADLLRDAETAMYRAKELGRDRHVLFDPSLHGRAVALLALETDLRRAIERDDLLLHFQPIVGADSMRVHGLEALVRWRHLERGIVPPFEFIGFAEDTGLIVPLGEWVLRRAIEQMRDWRAAGVAPERIAVNLSARQLHQEDLVERIAAMLARAGLEPGCLELELTEGVVAEDAESTVRVLQDLRRLGVQLAVDDFGTGYSSLAYLTRFPVSTVKVDRAFLIDIQHDAVNQAIVQAVSTLAHRIGMRVVAEGIETSEQLELARSLGCDEVQGYLVSRPLAGDEATIWLSEQRSRSLMGAISPLLNPR
jgi:diguanylate cyclase (GGDEF)-like protein/PAS domain S-box-containing protein